MEADKPAQSSAIQPRESGGLGSQDPAQLSTPSPHLHPAASSASLQTGGSRSTFRLSRSSWRGFGDIASSTALGVTGRLGLEQSGSQSVFSAPQPAAPMETYHRVLHVVKEDGRGREDLKVAIALFDSGSQDVNLISDKLAKDVKAELHSPSILSQGLDIIVPKRRKRAKALEKLRGVDGTSIRQQGKVKIRWYCLDPTTYNKQVLWFKRSYYETEHYVVKNVPADLLFSIREWDNLGLREGPSPVCMITRPPKPDMSTYSVRLI